MEKIMESVRGVNIRPLRSFTRYLLKRLEEPNARYEQRIINNMENLYQHIQPGDVLLVEGRSNLSRIIGLLTQSPWSHVALYVGDQLPFQAEDEAGKAEYGTIHPHALIEAHEGTGVEAVPLRKYENYNIRICRPFGISSSDLQVVISEVIGNLGKQYDNQNIADLALMLMPRFINPFRKRTVSACLGGCTEYQVICSGMIARAFQKVGYPIVPVLQQTDAQMLEHGNPYGSKLIMRHYSQITPRDFDLSPNFQVIKYNIVGLGRFDYKSIWADKPA